MGLMGRNSGLLSSERVREVWGMPSISLYLPPLRARPSGFCPWRLFSGHRSLGHLHFVKSHGWPGCACNWDFLEDSITYQLLDAQFQELGARSTVARRHETIRRLNVAELCSTSARTSLRILSIASLDCQLKCEISNNKLCIRGK